MLFVTLFLHWVWLFHVNHSACYLIAKKIDSKGIYASLAQKNMMPWHIDEIHDVYMNLATHGYWIHVYDNISVHCVYMCYYEIHPHTIKEKNAL